MKNEEHLVKNTSWLSVKKSLERVVKHIFPVMKVQILLIGSYWSLVGIILIWARLGTGNSLNRILLECSPLRAEKTSFNSWFLSVLETEDDI